MRESFYSSLNDAMLTVKEQKIDLRREVARKLSELTKEEKDKQSEIVVRKVSRSVIWLKGLSEISHIFLDTMTLQWVEMLKMTTFNSGDG